MYHMTEVERSLRRLPTLITSGVSHDEVTEPCSDLRSLIIGADAIAVMELGVGLEVQPQEPLDEVPLVRSHSTLGAGEADFQRVHDENILSQGPT